MTAFTTISALRNMPHGDRFLGSSGFADWANAGSAVIARQTRKPANLAIIPPQNRPPGSSLFVVMPHVVLSSLIQPPGPITVSA